MRSDEFSLHIGYRAPGRGSWPRPEIPGFYLRATYSNEGEAEDVVSERLLSPRQLQDILYAVAGNLPQDNEGPILRSSADRIAADMESALQASFSSARQQQREVEARLRTIREAAANAGIKLDNSNPEE